jgi:hypothetical protein
MKFLGTSLLTKRLIKIGVSARIRYQCSDDIIARALINGINTGEPVTEIGTPMPYITVVICACMQLVSAECVATG